MTSGLNDILARLDEERDDLCRDAAAFIRAQANTIEAADTVVREARICIKSCVQPTQPHLCHAALTMIEDFLRRPK